MSLALCSGVQIAKSKGGEDGSLTFGPPRDRLPSHVFQNEGRILSITARVSSSSLDSPTTSAAIKGGIGPPLDAAEQRERTHLAAELHDYLAQLLVLGRVKLEQLQRLSVPSAGDAMVREVDQVLSQALQYCQTLMAELSPPILHEQGLVAGIRALATQMKRYELEVRVEIDPMDECCLPISCTVLLFRSVRELLINTAKHAAVKQASIRLTCDKGLLQIVVRDESGFDLAASAGPQSADTGSVCSSKIGLLTIRERMKALNGRFDFASAPKQGTTATLTLPLGPRTTSTLSA